MNNKQLTRRTALASIGAASLSLSLSPNLTVKGMQSGNPIRLGIIADLHGGFADNAEQRLDAFLKSMGEKRVDGLIQLGDFAYPDKQHQHYADKFNAAHDETIHVIGNHEFDHGLNREDCYAAWGIKSAYYRHDLQSLRILVLDGNEAGSPTYTSGYKSYVGKQQQQWLEKELAAADRPVLILCHQPLAGQWAIDNATEIQALLGKFKDKITLCINGHSHVDSMIQVDGVTYLHLNSASYYWVGGEKRMSYYENPLFTTLTVDLAKSQLAIEGCSTRWKPGDAPNLHGYFEPADAPPETIVVPAIRERTISGRPLGSLVKTKPFVWRDTGYQLKIMTWNIWGRLNQDPRYSIGKKTARQRTIEVIRESGADIIAMIETYGSAKEIAESLGYHHYTPSKNANLCIFSRYPLSDVGTPTGLSSFSFIAATATLPNGRKIRVYDIWLTSSGRHIVEIKDGAISDQAFCDGDDIRFNMLEKFINHDAVKIDLANAEKTPVVIAGDFNCVSHLDHTPATRHGKLNHSRLLPIKVSKAMHKAGFQDTYRESNPDLLPSTLGHTWTTVGMGFVYESDRGFVPVKENPKPEYRDPYTRIDYIYSTGTPLRTKSSTVIKHHSSNANRSFPEFPSDHAAVMTEFSIKK